MSEQEGFRVTERIDDAHPKMPGYPLLPGDLLVRDAGRMFTKEAPGLAVVGFILTDDQESTLNPVRFHRMGLAYALVDVNPA